jgi:perosamine synthetase
MVVHLYGQVCDMEQIMAIAEKHRLAVIEDCAQCHLGTDRLGRLGGTIGDIGSFSLENSKMITTGEGGVLITNNELYATRMRKFGAMGYKTLNADNTQEMPDPLAFQDPAYLRHDAFGYNYRMSEFLAAIALAQTERIDFFFQKRIEMARRYLDAIDDCSWLRPQQVPTGCVNSYWTLAVVFEGESHGIRWLDFRDKFLEFGGDKCRSAFALVYNEPSMINLNLNGKYFSDIFDSKQGILHRGYLHAPHCPVAESIQPKIMQFTTNQNDEREMDIQADALRKTIKYFKEK